MGQIINSIIWVESRGDPTSYNHHEDSAGLMAIRGCALLEFNRWHGTWLTLGELMDPDTNRAVGSWYLTNYLLRYRTRNSIVQAVGAYNAGLTAIVNGVYPFDYLTAVIPTRWNEFRKNRVVAERWVNHWGQTMVRFADPPRLGE